jgi:quinol monooxygenase YgiN
VISKGDGMYAIFGSMNVKPEHVRAFREATIREARGTVSDEPGVFQFHILTDTDTPNRFYYFEIFRDEAAAEAHWETEIWLFPPWADRWLMKVFRGSKS